MKQGQDRGGYRFLLPNLKREPIGTQGEVAQYIPYRLEEGITPDSVRRELERMPHMAALAGTVTREEASAVLPGDVAGAAAEILEEYRELAKNEPRAIGFGV